MSHAYVQRRRAYVLSSIQITYLFKRDKFGIGDVIRILIFILRIDKSDELQFCIDPEDFMRQKRKVLGLGFIKK